MHERGALTKLAALIKSITPTEPPSEWDVDEPGKDTVSGVGCIDGVAWDLVD